MAACPYCEGDVGGVLNKTEPKQIVGCPGCLNVFLYSRPEGQSQAATHTLPGHRDVRELIAPGSVMEGVMNTVRQELDNIPPFPEAAHRVMAMVHDPMASISDLSSLIADDPVLSHKIRRLANSVFYLGVQEITDLNSACARVGFRAIANVAAASATSGHFVSRVARFRLLLDQLWQHCVATAYSCQVLADAGKAPCRNVAFIAGLVHDIGKLVLLDVLANKHKGPIGRIGESDTLLFTVLDRFHVPIGLQVARYWKMPHSVVAAVYAQSNPKFFVDDQDRVLAQAVRLASDLARASNYDLGVSVTTETTLDEALAKHPDAEAVLGVSQEALVELANGLPDHIEEMVQVLSAA